MPEEIRIEKKKAQEAFSKKADHPVHNLVIDEAIRALAKRNKIPEHDEAVSRNLPPIERGKAAYNVELRKGDFIAGQVFFTLDKEGRVEVERVMDFLEGNRDIMDEITSLTKKANRGDRAAGERIGELLTAWNLRNEKKFGYE